MTAAEVEDLEAVIAACDRPALHVDQLGFGAHTSRFDKRNAKVHQGKALVALAQRGIQAESS
jgi:hypothetical protein